MTLPNGTEQLPMPEPELPGVVRAMLDELAALIDRVERGRFDPLALLTRDEIAAHLRCTKQHVSALTNSGRLHAVRIGKRVLVPRVDLDAFICGEQARVTDGRWPPTPSMFDDDDDDDTPEPA